MTDRTVGRHPTTTWQPAGREPVQALGPGRSSAQLPVQQLVALVSLQAPRLVPGMAQLPAVGRHGRPVRVRCGGRIRGRCSCCRRFCTHGRQCSEGTRRVAVMTAMVIVAAVLVSAAIVSLGFRTTVRNARGEGTGARAVIWIFRKVPFLRPMLREPWRSGGSTRP